MPSATAGGNNMRFLPTLLSLLALTATSSIAKAVLQYTNVLRLLRGVDPDALLHLQRAERPCQVQLHQRDPFVSALGNKEQRKALKRRTHFRHVATAFHRDAKVARVAVDNAMSDNEFLIRIGVGTPPQYLWTAFDTGSPDTWLYSDACCFRSNHSFFDPSASSTFSSSESIATESARESSLADNPTLFTISYGDQSTVTANLSFDTFTFDSKDRAKHASIVLPTQPFGRVHSISDAQRITSKADALMGLSPGSDNALGSMDLHTPLENLVRTGKLAAPLMSITLVKSSEAHGDSAHFGGRITLGEVDDAARLGPLVWTNSTSTAYWGASLDGGGAMHMGGVDLYANSALTPRFIVDTGSAVIFLPPALAALAHTHIEGAVKTNESNSWVVPCTIANGNTTNARDITQPLFSIRIGGRRFAVPPEDMVMYPDIPFAKDSETGRNLCLSGIQDGKDQFSVLGNTFIKNHLVVLKYVGGSLQNRQIGISWRRDAGVIVDDFGKPIARLGPRPQQNLHVTTLP